MFESQNKIIIVDDDETHLQTLAKVFTTAGIGCRTIHYDAAYNTPLSGVRIAFFDINISNKSIDLKKEVYDYKSDRNVSSAFNDLAIAIRSTIDKDNGPYALVFWSQNVSLKDNFVEYVRDVDRGFADLPSPILMDSIDKSRFLEEPAGINDRIEEIFRDNSIRLLLDFESTASSAVTSVVDNIYKIIPKNPLPQDQIWANYVGFEENFDLVFSTIAVKTLGNANGKNAPDKAIYEALVPCIENEILTRAKSKDIWQHSLKSLSLGNINFPNGFNEGKLNSIFHIEENIINKGQRGVVISLDKTNDTLLSSFEIQNIDKWFNTLIPYLKGKNKIKNKVRLASKFVAIEISAACDYTNNKSRINKYALGFITPVVNLKEDLDRERNSPSSYNLSGVIFSYKGENVQIWLNLNYIFGSSSEDQRFGDALFVLKKEMMDMIGNAYANHVSRIGITSF